MKSGNSRFVLCVSLAMLGGCSSGFNTRPLGPEKLRPLNDSLTHAYLGDGKNSATTAPIDLYLNAKNSDPDKLSYRNQIVTGLIAIDDFDFQDYAAKSGFAQRASATVGDFTVLGLTTAATVVGGEQAKTVLAGIAALVTGGRIAVDKEVFYDNTMPVLLQRMQKLREQKREVITRKLNTTTVAEYPLESAMSDVLDYYRLGTIAAAEADIQEETDRIGVKPDLSTLADEVAQLNQPFDVDGKDNSGAATKLTYKIAGASWVDDQHKELNLVVAQHTPVSGKTHKSTFDSAARQFILRSASQASGAPILGTVAEKTAFGNVTFKLDDQDNTIEP